MTFTDNNGAKGQAAHADKAPAALPDAPPNDGEGRNPPADEARSFVPSPSPISRTGRNASAAEARAELPVSADPNDGGKGQLPRAAEANIGMPLQPSPKLAEPDRGPLAEKAKQQMSGSAILAELYELQVRRKFYISVVNKQTNAAKALVRRALGWRYDSDEGSRTKMNGKAARIVASAIAGKEQREDDVIAFASLRADLAVIAQAIHPCANARHEIELAMQRSVRRLPIYEWAKEVKGLGERGLAVILAEAGDLSGYPKKGHLWKRLGLAPYKDKAYSTWRREGGLSADEWTDAGYSPRRRAEVFAVISEPLLKAQLIGKEKSGTKHGQAKGPYGEIYVRRREHLDEAHPDWTPKHCQMDALRVMTKILLRDLLREWKREKANNVVPDRAKPELPSSVTNGRTAIVAMSKMTSLGVPSARAVEKAMLQVPDKAAVLLPSDGADLHGGVG